MEVSITRQVNIPKNSVGQYLKFLVNIDVTKPIGSYNRGPDLLKYWAT